MSLLLLVAVRPRCWSLLLLLSLAILVIVVIGYHTSYHIVAEEQHRLLLLLVTINLQHKSWELRTGSVRHSRAMAWISESLKLRSFGEKPQGHRRSTAVCWFMKIEVTNLQVTWTQRESWEIELLINHFAMNRCWFNIKYERYPCGSHFMILILYVV